MSEWDIEISTLGQIAIMLGSATLGYVLRSLVSFFSERRREAKQKKEDYLTEHYRTVLNEVLNPIYSFLNDDLVNWTMRISFQKEERYEEVYAIEISQVLPNLDAIVEILRHKRSYLYFSENEQSEINKFLRHVKCYHVLRNEPKLEYRKLFPRHYGCPFPVAFATIIEEKRNLYQKKYNDILGLYKQKEDLFIVSQTTANTQECADQIYHNSLPDSNTNYQPVPIRVVDVDNPSKEMLRRSSKEIYVEFPISRRNSQRLDEYVPLPAEAGKHIRRNSSNSAFDLGGIYNLPGLTVQGNPWENIMRELKNSQQTVSNLNNSHDLKEDVHV